MASPDDSLLKALRDPDRGRRNFAALASHRAILLAADDIARRLIVPVRDGRLRRVGARRRIIAPGKADAGEGTGESAEKGAR